MYKIVFHPDAATEPETRVEKRYKSRNIAEDALQLVCQVMLTLAAAGVIEHDSFHGAVFRFDTSGKWIEIDENGEEI